MVSVVGSVAAGDDRGAEIDIGQARRADANARPRALAIAAAGDHQVPRRNPVAAAAASVISPVGVPGATSGGIFARSMPAASRISADHCRVRMSSVPVGSADATDVDQRPVSRICQIGVHLRDARGAIQGRGLMLAQPDHAVEARDDVQRLAGDRVDPLGAEAFAETLLLCARPVVEPDHAGPERRAILGEDSEGLALIGNADRGDARGVDLGGHVLQRLRRRPPPIVRVLLEEPGLGIRHRYRRAAFRESPARAVPGDRLGRGGR